MIENHLYSLVTVVKYKLLPCLLAIFLTGCDRTEVTLSFTPEMASFSNEFDFDPLRGPVKDFTQTLMDEQGEVTKRVSGTLSEEGCFDSLELLDLEIIPWSLWYWTPIITVMPRRWRREYVYRENAS
ncbi:putative lipoprotein [Escherichia coli TA271]|nr:putative lipoprotein [Escherichia coli TA271]